MRHVANQLVLFLLVFCAGWDVKKREVPLILLGIMGGIVVLSMIIAIISNPDSWKTEQIWSKIGGAVIGGLLLMVSRITKEAIGYGDSWLILLIGLHLGMWDVLRVLLWASVLAGVCSVFFLWVKKWNRTASLPFIPFIAISYLGVILT